MGRIEMWAEGPNGKNNITEGVQVLYDLVLSSMDFGSGFLSCEEVIAIADLAAVCGFDQDAPRSELVRHAKHVDADHKPTRDEAIRARMWLDAHPQKKGSRS